MSQSSTFQPVEGHPTIQSKSRLFKTYDEPEKKKEMTAFTEYRSTDAPPPSLGRAGDIFVRTLNKKEQVYARYSNEPLWRVLESFSNTLLHPVADPQRYLWFTLNRFGWVSEKEKRTMRRVASVHDSIKSMLDLEAKNRKRAGAGLDGPASKRKKIVEDPATTATSATQIQQKPLMSPLSSRSSTSTSVSAPALDLLPLPDITIGSPTKTASTHIPTPTSIPLKAPSASVSVSKSSPKPRVPTAGAKSTPAASPSKVVSTTNIKATVPPPLYSSPTPPSPLLTKPSTSHKRKRVESPSPTPPESPSALQSFSPFSTGTNSGDANVDTHASSPDNGGDIDSEPNPYTSPDRIRLERLQKRYQEKEDEVRMLREELRLSQSRDQSQEEKDKSDSKSTKRPRHPSKNDSSSSSPSHLFDRDISPEIDLPERKQQQQDLNQRLTPPLTPLIGQGPPTFSFSANASRQRVHTPVSVSKTNANTITNASTSAPTPSHRPPPLKLGSVSGMPKPTPTPPTSTPHLDLSQFDIVPVPSLRQAKTRATAVVKAAGANKKAGDAERRKEKDSGSAPSSARNPDTTPGAKTSSTPKSTPTSTSAPAPAPTSTANSRPTSMSTTARGLPTAPKPKPVSSVSKEKEKIKSRNKVTTLVPTSKLPSASMTARSSSISIPAPAHARHSVSRASSATKAETRTSTTRTSPASAKTEDADVKVKLEDSTCIKAAASTSAIPGAASGVGSPEAECIDLTLDSDDEDAGIVTQTQASVKPDNKTGPGAMTGVGVKEEDGEGLALPTWSASFAAVEETDTEADGKEGEGGDEDEEERDELRSSPGLDSESESGQAQVDMAEESVDAVTEAKILGQSTMTTVPASEVKQEPFLAEVKTEPVQASVPIRPVNSAGKDDSDDDIMEIDVHEFSVSVRASKGKVRASASMSASVGPRGSSVAASVGADYEKARGVEAETTISRVDEEVGGDEMQGEQEKIWQPPTTKTVTETKQHGSSSESAQDDPRSLDPGAPSNSVTTSSTVPSIPVMQTVESKPSTPSPSPLPPDFRVLESVFQLDTNGDNDNSPFSGSESKRRLKCIKECNDELHVKGHRLRVSHLRVAFYPMKEDESDLENECESVSEYKAERGTETGYKFVCMLCLAGKTPINTHFNHTHTPLDIAKHVEDVHSDSVNQILQFSEAELVSLMEKM
ncbi:hypothetical protein VKT23_009529 [Stygiomarasmius scandens]|uniref:Uncharacterized protein n=1 Tax=Marasmiellus scandens TaxID=2682957 RepID=A0ABR1JIP0_9AGAR